MTVRSRSVVKEFKDITTRLHSIAFPGEELVFIDFREPARNFRPREPLIYNREVCDDGIVDWIGIFKRSLWWAVDNFPLNLLVLDGRLSREDRLVMFASHELRHKVQRIREGGVFGAENLGQIKFLISGLDPVGLNSWAQKLAQMKGWQETDAHIIHHAALGAYRLTKDLSWVAPILFFNPDKPEAHLSRMPKKTSA